MADLGGARAVALRAAPLVGRRVELDVVEAVLDAGGTVVAAGAAGVGKSRFVREIGGRARARGWLVGEANATLATQALPLAAVAHLLPPEALDVSPDRLVPVLTAALRSEEGVRRLIVVDDAHLLDEASAVVVRLLAGHRHVSLVVVVRTGEPLRGEVETLCADDAVVHLELQPLSELEVSRLVALLLGGPTDRATRRLLWERTRGNVLFLRELVADALARQALVRRDGVWQVRGELVVGPSLRDLIQARLARLSPAERELLETVAVGEPVPVSVFEDPPSSGSLDRLVDEGTIEIRTNGRRQTVVVAHPLYGEVVRAEVPGRRVAALCGMLADRIEGHGMRRRDDRLRVTMLRLDAGADVDHALLLQAAWEAWMRHDLALVDRIVSRSLRAGPHVEASFLLGAALADRGRHDEALAVWEPILDGDCPDQLRVRVAHATATVLAHALDQPERADETILSAIARVASGQARARLVAIRAGLFGRAADVDAAMDASRSEDASEEVQVWAWVGSARVRTATGQLDSVLSECDGVDVLAKLARKDWPLSTVFVSLCRFYALLAAGRLDVAEELSTAGLESDEETALPFVRACWSEAIGLVALTRGDLDGAESHFSEAVTILRENDNGTLRPALHELAHVSAMRGDAGTTNATLAEAAGSRRGILEPLVPEVRVLAALHAAEGDTSVAVELLVSAIDGDRSVRPYHELLILHDVARYGAAATAVPRLAELAAVFDGELAPLFHDHASALAARDGVALLEISARCEELGLVLDAAESAAAGAEAFRSAGNPRAEVAATARARQLEQFCGRARTPMLRARPETSALTPREHEVARLAAQGLADSDIAGRLSISVRTVNAHLRSVYAKLGVRGRHDLATVPGLD